MATTSKLLANGDYQVSSRFDEYTLPFNSYAAQFNGSNQWLTVTNTSSSNFGTGDFTIEAWIYINVLGGASITNASNGGSTDINYFALYSNSSGSGYVWEFQIRDSGSQAFVTGTIVTPLRSWVHVAVTRQSGVCRLFVNGVLDASTTITKSITAKATNIGSFQFTGYNNYDNSLISNVRIITGTAIYTSTFRPPTSPLTAISGTSLLTCQNPTFVDNSSYASSITNNGSVTATNIPTRLYGAYFSGSSNFQTAVTSVTAFQSNDFTIECWLNFYDYSATTTYRTFYQNYDDPFVAGSIYMGKHASYSGKVSIWFASYSTSGALLIEADLPPSGWNHYAVTRQGSTFRLFRNGVITATGTYSGSVTNSTNFSRIGAGFYGNISNHRIINGTALYTANFTPSTSPLSVIKNTALLTCQSPTLIDNSYNALALTNNGSVTTFNPISWAVKKEFSTGDIQTFGDFDEYTLPNSVYATQFNGSSQYLTTPSNAGFSFGTGDFTIEAWIYTNSSAVQRIVSTGNSPYEFLLVNTGANVYLNFYDGTADNTTGSNYVPQNQWAHVAVSRAGTSLKLFINGVLSGTTTNSINLTNSTTMHIGRYGASAIHYFSGYISNLRIIKGTALYTSNFTPLLSPLTAITNTSLLTCQNPTIIDNSTNALTITNNGSATTSKVTTGASFIKTKSRLFSDGVLQLAGDFDEYTISVLNIDYLVVAGGGSGGSWMAGGGGAGGYISGSGTATGSITITVGAGGASVAGNFRGNNGNDSILPLVDGTITATGGGGGGNNTSANGKNGGSGGGASLAGTAGTGVVGQGYQGGTGEPSPYSGDGNCGGGGGASAVGGNATSSVGGVGGAGAASSITGASVTYAGGGGGGRGFAGSSAGGAGGGGAGASFNSNATAGTVNTGGGGGGARDQYASGAGGSGVVIIRFLNTYADPASYTGSPTITNTGGYKIYKWTTSGSITF